MLDLEAKLSSFRKMVWDEEKQNTDNELFESTEKNSTFIDQKKSNLEKIHEKRIKDRYNFLNTRKNEEISKINEEEKNNFYAYKEELLDDFYNKLKQRLIEYRKTPAYKNSLEKQIRNMINKLGLQEDKIVVAVIEDDLSNINFKHTDSLDRSFLGGFMLKDMDGSFRYNFTYKQKINEKKYEFGKKLYQVLESESFNESNN